MSDLTIEVLADDLTEHIFSLLQEKDEQFRVQSGGNEEEYERYFKKWLNECFCEFGSKCEDFGYYQVEVDFNNLSAAIKAADTYIRCLRQMVYAGEQSVIDEAFKNANTFGATWHRLRNQCDIPPLD